MPPLETSSEKSYHSSLTPDLVCVWGQPPCHSQSLTLKRRKAANQQVRLCSSSLQKMRSPLWPFRSLFGCGERKLAGSISICR